MILAKGCGEGYHQLTADDIQLGEPLKFTVFSAAGTLLLKKGYIVRTENQRRQLLYQKVFRAAASRPAETSPDNSAKEAHSVDVFETVSVLCTGLQRCLDELAWEPSSEVTGKFKNFATGIQLLLNNGHADGLLAGVIINKYKAESLYIKALHIAILCEMLGKRVGLKPSERLSIIAAGLTHDVAMWHLKEIAFNQEAPLSRGQWAMMRNHPLVAEELLKMALVTDPVWLEAVLQHHERIDGSGYPKGLKGDQISQAARILTIADIFSAMVHARPDRPMVKPKDALKHIFQSRNDEIDGALAQVFIKDIGLYPPGSVCKLSSGEVGIATGRGINSGSPDVGVIISQENKLLKHVLMRDTSDKKYTVLGVLPLPEHPGFEKLLLEMWPKIKQNSVLTTLFKMGDNE